ncbi:MAG: ABC transporter permease subunit, partial [Planctomycetota bacterium]
MPTAVSARFNRSFPPLPWTIVCVLASSAVVAPLAVVLGSVFYDSSGAWSHVCEHTLAGYAANTAVLVALVGLGSLAVGCTTAWLVTAYRFPGRGMLSWMLLLPIAVPGYIGAYMLTDLLQFSGPVQTTLRGWFGWQAGDYWFPPIRSLGGAAFVLVFSLYPYVYIAARIAFASQSRTISDAARTLGLGPLARFTRLSFPIARPAVIAGVLLVVMETLADYGTVDYFAIDTLATGVYRVWYGLDSQVAALQLSVLLVSVSALVILIERWLHRDRVRRTDPSRFSPLRPISLTPPRSAAVFAICTIPVL